MTLYEINTQIAGFEFEIDENTGEILNFDALRALNMAKDEKRENIALYIKNLTAEAKAIREEEKTLAERRQAIENKAERLKLFLADDLAGEKFQTPRVACSFRKSESVAIMDEAGVISWAKLNAIPILREKIDIDKTALREKLKAGVDIVGAALIEKQNLQIK